MIESANDLNSLTSSSSSGSIYLVLVSLLCPFAGSSELYTVLSCVRDSSRRGVAKVHSFDIQYTSLVRFELAKCLLFLLPSSLSFST